MNAQSWVTTPPMESAEVVTILVRPEYLDGIASNGQSRDSLSLLAHFGPGLAPSLAKSPAREASSKAETPSAALPSPSAPNLSGFPGTGSILF